ncbi:MAG: peptidoglycan DD-metalloendopeptidase family protein, partial [bacterium]
MAGKLCAYQIDRYPLDEQAKVTATFGQYRNWKGYLLHDGMDLAGGIDGKPVYPLAEGVVEEVETTKPKEGYGNYIVIKYDKATPIYESLYGHLKDITKIMHDGEVKPSHLKTGDRVTKTQVVGHVGNTGKSTGSHLHINIGATARGGGQENPLAVGLPQSRQEDAKIVEYTKAAYYSNSFIRILAPGNGNKFYNSGEIGNNKEINYLEPNKPVKIIVEAYQNPDSQLYKTCPYGIDFTITKIGGTLDADDYTIYKRFNKSYKTQVANAESYYNLAKPWVTNNTNQNSAKDFYYIDWTPASTGLYKVEVSVYSAYQENGFLKFQDPPDTRERLVTVGMAGVDYPFYQLAYNPNEPKETVGVAAGVRVAAVDDAPEIYYNDLSTPYFSINPGDQNFPRNTIISARADREVEWTVKVFNSSDGEVAQLTAKGERLSKEWNGAGDGTYTYQITAKDPTTGKETIDYGVAAIQMDNQRPSLSLKSDSTVYIVTTEAKAILEFSSDEDLYTTQVDVVDKAGASVIDYLATSPNLEKNQVLRVEWENPGDYPEDWYFFQVRATDLAGNQAMMRVPIGVDFPGGDSIPDKISTKEAIDKVEPSEEIKKLKIGDIAFDKDGNKYVVYTNMLRVVKYDSSGKEVGAIESYDDVSLWYPLGVTVSPSGDRVYVADTYNNLVMIYDSAFTLIKEIKGQDVYITNNDVDACNWSFGMRTEDKGSFFG